MKSDVQHNSAKKVKLVEQFRYYKSFYKTLSGSSQTIEDIIGEALPEIKDVAPYEHIAYVEIIPEADINMNVTGDAATTANGIVKAGAPKLIPGNKKTLNKVELIGSGGISIFLLTTDTDYVGS